jgi:hypothetical protein
MLRLACFSAQATVIQLWLPCHPARNPKLVTMLTHVDGDGDADRMRLLPIRLVCVARRVERGRVWRPQRLLLLLRRGQCGCWPNHPCHSSCCTGMHCSSVMRTATTSSYYYYSRTKT